MYYLAMEASDAKERLNLLLNSSERAEEILSILDKGFILPREKESDEASTSVKFQEADDTIMLPKTDDVENLSNNELESENLVTFNIPIPNVYITVLKIINGHEP